MSQPRSGFKPFLESAKGFTDPPTEFAVYGQAPGNDAMTYPAVVYEKDDEEVVHADNLPYNVTDGYLVTVMEKDVNTPIAKLIRQLPTCRFNRAFVSENVNHTVYKIFF
jgi:hypothetical protein